MQYPKFSGIIPPVSTLFTDTGAVDRAAMAHVIDMLIGAGVNGLFFLGTGGEFSQMSADERRAAAETVIDCVKGRVPVLIGTGSPNMREAVELSRHAASAGADGIVAINPYYWKVTETNLFRYFGAIAESIDLPMLVYNFPDLTGQDLTPEIIKRLADANENIVGVKDTIDSVGHLRRMIDVVKGAHPDFSVFCGYDDHLVNTLLMGGDGAISASVNFAPQLSVGIYRAFLADDLATMTSLNRQLLKLPKLYGLDAPFVNVVKEAMRLTGLPVSTYALPPAGPVSEAMSQTVRQVLVSAGVLED
ncbi:dihydrodipicolinate synthase family protein [Martelella alba]|uniref:Dihydrodipicolinate synthase family protein n=1 Tax=Martelella alba TaxID=2590451 RepID=A0A506UF09_9HYPH|nr:dihydrodipicolinate synthase family protein [Martelella alba]TPW31584.1 dihydrodipicolinate synthase family protein [Martelella alba]